VRVQTQRDTFAFRIAAEDVVLPPDEPHDDWRPRWPGTNTGTEKWHPPFGETHVKYHIYRGGGGRNPVVWGVNHHGLHQGMETIEPPSGDYGSITSPRYSLSDEPEQLGRFKTPEKAKAAAEQHYAENYGRPQKSVGDYDINQLMRDQGFS